MRTPSHKSTLEVLLVGDDPEYFRRMRTLLEHTNKVSQYWFSSSAHGSVTKKQLHERRPAVIIVDQGMFDSTLPFLDEIATTAGETPIILTVDSEADGEAAATAAAQHNMTVLVKEALTPERLNQTITFALERTRLIAALRDAEARYQLLANNTTDLISRHSPDGVFLSASPSFRRILNCSPDGLTGRSAFDFIHPLDQAAVVDAIQTCVRTNGRRNITFRVVRAHGRSLWVEATLQIVRDPETNSLAEIIATSRDVTETKNAEQAEKEQRVLAEALRNTTEALTSTLDLKTVMSRILENVGLVVPHDAANIKLIEDDSARIAYWKGYPDHLEQYFSEQRYPLSLEGHQYMLRTGKPRLTVSTDGVPDWIHLPGDAWVRSCLEVPIRVHDRIIGFISLDSRTRAFFNETHAYRLQAFADQAGIALENARLYDALRQYATEQEQRVVERTTQLKHTNERIEALLNNSIDAILVAFSDGSLQKANPAFHGLFGYTSQDVAELTLAALVMPQEWERVQTAIQNVVASSQAQRLEVLARRSDGSAFPADMALSASAQAQSVDILCSMRDITEQREVEERQAAMTSGLRSVLLAAGELLTYPDLHSVTRRAIELAREKLGLERAAIFMLDHDVVHGTFGTDMNGIMTDEHELSIPITGTPWEKIVTNARTHESTWFVQRGKRYQWQKALGSTEVAGGWFAVTPLRSATGLLGFMVNDAAISETPLDEMTQDINAVFCSILANIIERKRVEQEIRDAFEKERELGELKSRFVSMVSHEFRTPLASIMISSELLKRHSDRMSTEMKAAQVTKIQNQIRHLTNLMDDVLTIGKSDMAGLTPQPEVVDLFEFCSEVAQETQQMAQGKHRVVFDSSSGCPQVLVDVKLLRQILFNLLSNATKYSPDGGTVTLLLHCDEEEFVLQVKDQGMGIPAEGRDRIFDTFHRATNVGSIPGTGLGLAIVKRAVDALNGTIDFESQEGVGTTFFVRIPLTRG